MILFYKLSDPSTITRCEDNTMTPVLPANKTYDEKKIYYASIGEDFISIPYEMGVYVYNFKLCFDSGGGFIGLQPK